MTKEIIKKLKEFNKIIETYKGKKIKMQEEDFAMNKGCAPVRHTPLYKKNSPYFGASRV
jgi:hypothetical protein